MGALATWENGNVKGLKKEVFKSWCKYTMSAKAISRKKRAVEDALLRSFEGDRRGTMHLAFMNWKHLTDSEKQVRAAEAHLKEEHAKLESFIASRDRKHSEAVTSALLRSFEGD